MNVRALPATFDSMSPVICCSVPPRATDAMCQIPCFFPTVLSLLHLISKKGAETAGREKPEWHSPAATLGRTNNDSLVRGTIVPQHTFACGHVSARLLGETHVASASALAGHRAPGHLLT